MIVKGEPMKHTQILVVEDEPNIAEVVGLYLRRAGYTVHILGDGLAARRWLEIQTPDLIVLDIMLPGLDGIALARWIRDQSDVPIIMLTARREESDRIAGLEMGADDYVVKPFSPQELVSRVRAVLRRAHPASQTVPEIAITFADLSVDPQTRLVLVRGAPASLTAREFDLLWLFARHPRQVFTRGQLLEQVWGVSEYIDPGTVTVHVRRLREKIEQDPASPAHLLTVWGVGYKFEP
jgi:DNA-binding response OmpR family regulator